MVSVFLPHCKHAVRQTLLPVPRGTLFDRWRTTLSSFRGTCANQFVTRCLKLDGFVIDRLPFEHELTRIVLLTCGESCVDAGLRAPKTPRAPLNKWGSSVNKDNTHSYIVWPSWSGIFDNQGQLLDAEGSVDRDEERDVDPAIKEGASSDSVPLTKEFFDLEDLEAALREHKRMEPLIVPGSPLYDASQGTDGAPTSLDVASNASTRGSAVPTSPVMTAINSSALVDAIDNTHNTNGEVDGDVDWNAATAGSTKPRSNDGTATPPNIARKMRRPYYPAPGIN